MMLPVAYRIVTTPTPQNKFMLIRGQRPSVDDIPDGGTILAQFKNDISLETGWFEFLHGEEEQEQRTCRRLGVNYFGRPMSDVSAPTVAQVKEILSTIDACLLTGHTLVHCEHGVDRTGIVCAAYRITRQGWTVEKAVSEMYSLGFHRFPYFYWVSVLSQLG
jgi:protein-tyrosine phosphatase